MQIFKYFFCVSIIFLLSRCNTHENIVYRNIQIGRDTFISKTTFDKNGDSTIYELLNKDSLNQGYYRERMSNHNIYSGNFKAGKKEGEWVVKNLEGDTIKIENWFSGKKFGDQFEYYPERLKKIPRIYEYSFLGIDEERLCFIKYDLNQNILESKGLPVYFVFNKDEIKRGDTYDLICFWGCPQQMAFNLTIKEKYKNKVISMREINSTDTLNFQQLDFAKKTVIEKRYLANGKYLWDIHLKLINRPNNSYVINDSTSTDVIVK